jgi:hypothetical protein
MGGLSREILAYHLKFARFGVSYYEGHDGGLGHMATYHGVLVAAWLPGAGMLSLLCLVLWQMRLDRRRPAHACPTCHYDLRAHRAGEKCPECGTLIPAHKSRP